MFRVHWLRSALALLLVAGALCLQPLAHAQPTPTVCDCDSDGDVDKVDINLIANARGQAASGPTDPRDPDRDNKITSADARTCTARCTSPKCASSTNRPPIADAGPDQTVFTDQPVTLDGSDSTDPDGDPLTFRWTILRKPAGSNVTLTGATSVSPKFTPDVDGVYEMQLIVNDKQSDSAPDTVIITTGNAPPVADAGDDQTVVTNTLVTLDGSGSSDINGDPLTYSWSFVARPSGSNATLSSSTAVMPTFTPDRAGLFRLRLIVNDGKVDSQPDEVVIDTRAQPNKPPIADAGDDQTVDLAATVTLDGSGSHDPDNGPSPLTYTWALLTRPAGSTAVISNTSAVHPTFKADKAGEYVAQLIVNDGADSSAPDTVRITTRNTRPVADAGDDQTGNVNANLSLDGTGSFDADGDPLSYQWSFTSRPGGSTAAIANPQQPRASFVPDLPGLYVVQLVVNDAQFDSLPDTATITIIVPTVPTLSIDDASITEGNSGTKNLSFTVSLSPAATGTVTVNYGTADGSATVANADYTAKTGTLTYTSGQASKTVTVSIRGDTAVESDENFFVNLSGVNANATIADAQGVGTIVNDDTAALPTVTIVATDAAASEPGTNTGLFTIRRTGPTDAALNVFYGIGGTAGNGGDYAPINTVVTIPQNASSATVLITPLDDQPIEPVETVILSLNASAATYVIGTPSSATVNISDDTPNTVTIVATDATASEPGANTGLFTISRTGPTTFALNVFYGIGGTAGNGGDYSPINTVVTIPQNASSATVLITPLDDTLVEGSETVTLSINTSATTYVIGTPSSATVNIADDDSAALPTITIQATDASAAEAGPNAGGMRITRSGGNNSQLLNVNTSRAGSTSTNASDYASVGNTFQIPAGQSFIDVTFTPIDDALVEGPETIIVAIVANANYTIGTPNSATVTIEDNDSLPTVSITATDPDAAEAGQNPGTMRVTRTGGNNTLLLNVNTSRGGSASNASDYASVATTIQIPAGQSFVDVTFTPADDALVEGPETIIATIVANANYIIGTPSSATVTIVDNDLPTVTVVATDASASEPGTNAGSFTISRTGPTTTALFVNGSFSGTAINGTDYSTISGSFSIPIGLSSVTRTISPIDDSVDEDDETVIYEIGAGSYVIGAQGSATVTIVDNDTTALPTVTITATDAAAGETSPNPGNGRFTVTRTGATTSPLTVLLSIGGSAINGTDYQTVTAGVTIPTGSATATVDVVPIDDSAIESPTETVILTVAANAGVYLVGSPGSAQVNITDNDVGAPLVFVNPAFSIGENLQLQNTARISAGVAPAGGLAIRIVSSNPNVLLSATPTGAGTQTLNVTIPANGVDSPTFYVQSLAASGTASLTIEILTTPNPGFSGGTPATVTLSPTGYELLCQSGGCTFPGNGNGISTTPLAAPALIYIWAERLSSSTTDNRAGHQAVRGGTTINLPLALSNTAIGVFRAYNNGTPGGVITSLAIPAGADYTYFYFDPTDTSSGSGTITFTKPAGAGTPLAGGAPYAQSMPVTVAGSTPINFAAPGTLMVGRDLQARTYLNLGAPAPAGGLSVRLASSSANVLLAATTTAAGSATLDITVAAGSTQSPFIYVQSLAASGTANVSIQILTSPNPGFSGGTPLAVTLVPAGYRLFCYQGPGTCTIDSATNRTALTILNSVGSERLYIEAYYLNPANAANNIVSTQLVRGGFTVTVPLSLTNASIGELRDLPTGNNVISQISIVGGEYFTYFYFDPNNASTGGTGVINYTKPATAGTPTSGGQPNNQSVGVTVTQ